MSLIFEAIARGKRDALFPEKTFHTFPGIALVRSRPARVVGSASEPGSYAIAQGSLAISANYDLTYVGPDLLVLLTYAVPPTDGAASIVARNADVRGGGAPLPVLFMSFTANAQALLEDPRLDQAALCRSMAAVSAVCVVSSAQ